MQQTSTQRSRLIRPSLTPWKSRSIRCSTDPIPLGILEKSPTPSSFWSFMQKGQWSVDTDVTSPVRMYFHSSSWWPSARARRGVEQTHLAPSKSPHCSLRAPSCSSSER